LGLGLGLGAHRHLQQQLAHRGGGLRLLGGERCGLVLVDAAEPLVRVRVRLGLG
jgi:hypothetical protein